MRRPAVRSQATVNNTFRDSASQVARATLGLREMLLRGTFRPGQRIARNPFIQKTRRFPHAVAAGF